MKANGRGPWRRLGATALGAAALLAGAVGGGAAAAAPPPIRLVSLARLNNATPVDQMMYTDEGLTLEALVAPGVLGAARGRPILVLLHGGYVFPQRVGNIDFGYTPDAVASWAAAFPQALVLAPEYRGYMASGGTLGTFDQAVLDARAAIRVAVRTFHADPNAVYLIGRSLGGGIALALATRIAGVRAVVAVSPYVGFAADAQWAERTAARTGAPLGLTFLAVTTLTLDQAFFGATLAERPQAYAAQSPNLTLLARQRTPVLLLQGSADPNVQWQTVRLFSNELAHAGGRVRFILYPGGHHGLRTEPYWRESNARLRGFLARFGLGAR